MRAAFATSFLVTLCACQGLHGRDAPLALNHGLTAGLLALAESVIPRDPEPPHDIPTCIESDATVVLVSPQAPRPGKALRVLVATDTPTQGALFLLDAKGKAVAFSTEVHGGSPYFIKLSLETPQAGTYRVVLAENQTTKTCKEVRVEEPSPSPYHYHPGLWSTTRAWDKATENLYSAWIEALFDAPLDESLTFSALHDVLRDPKRNFLYGYLGQNEDENGPKAPPIDPDCADLPYALRAYFAFKMELPFAYSACTRGGYGRAPTCKRPRSNLEWPKHGYSTQISGFVDFLRTSVADTVHSGTGRTAGDDNTTDFYPVHLDENNLRPGTIYADPYGHVLVIVKRIPQTKERAGMLLAVDGQPDGTVARRRYWRGNFLFALDPSLGGPGFKRFRPILIDHGILKTLSNEEINKHPEIGQHSLEQYEHGVEGFYDRVDDVLSPAPLDPKRALEETLDALFEQVKGRVVSVENGRKYRENGGKSVDMPDGPRIFETIGPWEDFSTPSRDLRLLVAIDVLRGLPARVERRPERFAMPEGKTPADVRKELETIVAKELEEKKFSYTRSDGSSFSLTLADVLSRAEALEMAYNPNDCVELRWGAKEGSDEASTCKRHAPWRQQNVMRKIRSWFKERKRPARG